MHLACVRRMRPPSTSSIRHYDDETTTTAADTNNTYTPARPRPWNLFISFHVIRFSVSVLLCSVLSYTSIDSNMAPAFSANFHLAFLGPNVSSLARARDPSNQSPGSFLRSSNRSESTSLFLPRAVFRSSGLGALLSSLLEWTNVQRQLLSRSNKGKGSSSETGMVVSSTGLDCFAS